MRHILDHDTSRQQDSLEIRAERYSSARKLYISHFGEPGERYWPQDYVPRMPRVVFVKKLAGPTITIVLAENATGADLKAAVCEKEGIPKDQQRLDYMGVVLEDGRSLYEQGVQHESTIGLVPRLRGC